MEGGEAWTIVVQPPDTSKDRLDGRSNLAAWEASPTTRRQASFPLAEHYEAIVVGAGPAGNAASLTLARADIDVLQIERSEYPGAKNVRGAVLYAPALDELMPDFRNSAPLERRIVEHWNWTLDQYAHAGSCERQNGVSSDRATRYTVLRAPFDAWFSAAVKAAGARVLCATAVTDLVREGDGRVIGVRTDRDDRVIFADIVILGDGVEALVARRSGLREELHPVEVAMTVKEIRTMPSEAIDARFRVNAFDGVMLEASTSFSRTLPGIGFIYTNRNSLSVGIGCLVSDVYDNDVSPSELLDRFKRHPSIQPLLVGSEVRDFSAQLFPEGGYRSQPRLFGDGWLTCGDATQRNDALHRDGSTMALTSGRLAAETVVELRRHGRPMTARHLSLYRDKLERSEVLRDLHRLQHVTPPLRDKHRGVSADPLQLAQATEALMQGHGRMRRGIQKTILARIARGRPPVDPIGKAL